MYSVDDEVHHDHKIDDAAINDDDVDTRAVYDFIIIRYVDDDNDDAVLDYDVIATCRRLHI